MDALEAFLQHAWQNIITGRGLEITGVGIFITFSSLTIISLLISAVPRMLEMFNKLVPPHTIIEKPIIKAVVQPIDTGKEVAAVVGLAFHSRNSAKKQ